jgi:thiamine kinase-like enzyme
VTEFDAIAPLYGGHTNSLVYRMVVGGAPYVLKIIVRAEDPSRHYANMRAVAEAGLAPRVRHTDTAAKISITDFVEAKPLAVSEALTRWPRTLRALHAVPPFDRAPFNTTATFLLDRGPMLDGYLERVRAAKVLPSDVSEELFARYAELAAVYPYPDGELVSCHNDLFKPDNTLYDGERVWLVDWEAAFLNDRYADLAVVAYHVVANDEEELAYLREYFDAAPDAYQRSRFHLMQQLAHVFYAMAFLFLGAAGKPVDFSGSVPSFREYYRRMWAREVDLADPAEKIVYGRVHWERLAHNVRQPRYREALALVGAGPAGKRVRGQDCPPHF